MWKRCDCDVASKIEELPRDVEASSQTRHHHHCGSKEAVHNIVKHAQASGYGAFRAEYVKPELRVSAVLTTTARGF